jgi:hypothetical protein
LPVGALGRSDCLVSGGVLAGDVADGDRFVAVGAESAEVDAPAGLVAVVAPLVAELAGTAVGAFVDGDGPSGRVRRDDDGRSGRPVTGAPGRLAAGGSAVALPADRGEWLLAGRAGRGRRRLVVVRKRRDKPV